MVEEVIPDVTHDMIDRPHGAVEALDGEIAGLGRLSTSVPPGLTAVLGGGGRARRAVAQFFVESGSTGPEGAIARWWRGEPVETLEGAFRRASDAVAESRGLGLVDQALETLGARSVPSSEQDPSRERPVGGAVRVDPDQLQLAPSCAGSCAGFSPRSRALAAAGAPRR